MADDVPGVVVQKRHHVHPLVLAQKEGEDIGHPHFICAGALEAPDRMASGGCGGLPLNKTLLVQDPPDLCLAHPQLAEARKHVADPPRPVLRMALLLLDDSLALDLCRLASGPRAALPAPLGHQGCRSALLVLAKPAAYRRGAHVERLGHLRHGDPVVHHCLHYTDPQRERVGLTRPASRAAPGS